MATKKLPDGIRDEHHAERAQPWWREGPIGVVILGAILAAGMLGLLGAEAERRAESAAAVLTVQGPERIPSGEPGAQDGEEPSAQQQDDSGVV